MANEENVNASRFSVLVPEPPTRLNMGKPETSNSSFGYPGLSLQSSKHVLLDVTKTTLMQTGQACLQTRGTWDQFSTGNMTLATKGDSKLDVGSGALTVNGTAMPAPVEMKVAIDTTAAIIAALKAKHATLIIAAKALGTSIETTDKTIAKANEALANVPMFNPIAAAQIIMQGKKAVRTGQKLRDGLLQQLMGMRVQYDAVVAEARSLGVDAIVSRVEEERALFRWWSRA